MKKLPQNNRRAAPRFIYRNNLKNFVPRLVATRHKNPLFQYSYGVTLLTTHYSLLNQEIALDDTL